MKIGAKALAQGNLIPQGFPQPDEFAGPDPRFGDDQMMNAPGEMSLGGPHQPMGQQPPFGGQPLYPGNRQMSGMAQPGRSGGPPLDNDVNYILFVSQLPRSIDSQILQDIFSEFQGFKEIREFKERGVAFVEFDTDEYARHAKIAISNKGILRDKIDDQVQINYAKK